MIGEDTRLYPLVTVRERSVIGARVIFHSGAVIGSDGFGYDFDPKAGRHVKIAHTGFVQIDDDVEIGANTTIDRGRFGRDPHRRGREDRQPGADRAQRHHRRAFDRRSQTGISGSTSLGRYVRWRGRSAWPGISRSAIARQSRRSPGLNKDVPAGAVLAGHHALPIRESLKLEALTRRLPDLVERLKALEAKVADASGLTRWDPMAASQNLRFAASIPPDTEFEHPPGYALMRDLPDLLVRSGWSTDKLDNWRDVGWSCVCRRESSEVEIVFAQIPKGEWLRQISPNCVPGLIGRMFGRTMSATPKDIYDLSLAIHNWISAQDNVSQTNWRWNGFPESANSKSVPQPQRGATW